MRKVAFIFPGQGSQHLGMGKGLYDGFDIARQTFEEANDALGYDLKKICFEGSLVELNKLENMLPAILTVSTAAFRVYMREIGVHPSFLAGHSLGEYSALVCSGALNFSDAIRITRKRSLLAVEVAEAVNGSMTIVDGIEPEIISEICQKVSSEDDIAAVSCFNSQEQAVISGHSNAMEKVEDLLFEKNAQVTPLFMSPPFHCKLMEAVAEELRKEIMKYSLNTPKWPVLSNVTALPYEGKEAIVDNLVKQIVHPVQWQRCMRFMRQNGASFVVELGPQSILSNLIKNSVKGMRSFAFAQQDDREALLKLFQVKGQLHIPNIIDRCMVIAVGTENRNWDAGEYQKGVVDSYKALQNIQKQLEQNGEAPAVEQMKEAIGLLEVILKTKKAPQEEIRKCMKEMLEVTCTKEMLGSLDGFSEQQLINFC
ncbi:MAG: ACP S-malonyltransferase [Clostridia bacterium]|nr:ACP S-malonyltransferase [Clostridia bacterium]